ITSARASSSCWQLGVAALGRASASEPRDHPLEGSARFGDQRSHRILSGLGVAQVEDAIENVLQVPSKSQ
ncbi:hypothetical protein, partial [Candidatus Dormiibacter inghamiae]|uniref:hypothetical protein n=1 Tax=Candidatus Dormiibacter inghamiae TaxID=3127013 RepID=UPI0030C73D05